MHVVNFDYTGYLALMGPRYILSISFFPSHAFHNLRIKSLRKTKTDVNFDRVTRDSLTNLKIKGQFWELAVLQEECALIKKELRSKVLLHFVKIFPHLMSLM